MKKIVQLFRLGLFCGVLLIASEIQAQPREVLNLESIFSKGTFSPERIKSIRSSKDGLCYYVLENGNTIVKYSYADRKDFKVILNISNHSEVGDILLDNIDDYCFNADESKILLSTNSEKLYRHSMTADYIVWDLKSNTPHAVSSKGKAQVASFSPDGNKVAFMRENNLYWVDLNDMKEYIITTDGKNNQIINGHTDWVYEEEFGFTKAYSWSPNSDQLAYLRFDESHVKEFSFAVWGELYPTKHTYKYPKAGEDNSKVSARVYFLNTKKTTAIDLGASSDQYIPGIQWSKNNDVVLLYRLNRMQNKFELLAANTKTAQNQVIYTETDKSFVDIPNEFYLFEDGSKFIISSEKDGYKHLYLYKMNGQLIKQLTSGNWEVFDFYGVDEANQKFYFQANNTGLFSRTVVAGALNNKKLKTIGFNDGFTNANFSNNYAYCILTHSDANTVPNYSLWSIGEESQMVKMLENNEKVNSLFAESKFAPKTFGMLKVSDTIPELAYWIMKPNQMDEGKKYPLLLFVYGGPGSTNVVNEYKGSDYLWYQYLVSQGYMVACVDNRGCGGRGADFKKSVYLQLGKYESEDQIAAAKAFAQMPFVDANRIAIWGWSYGGFLSTTCLFKAPKVFKVGIAVAPVTHWQYYDNIYTERYMRRPYENPDGYNDNSPLQMLDNLEDKFLLIHGTADDNVHFQNTVDLVRGLNEAGKQFELYVYPNKNHNLSGGKTRLHLYQKMTDFILEEL